MAGYITPAFVAIGVVLLVPLAATCWLSLTSWQGVGKPHFVGLANYRSMLSNGDFVPMLERTLVFAGVGSIGVIAVGLILAELIRTGVKGDRLFSALWFIPVVTPVTAVGIFFTNALTPITGAVNVILGDFGLGKSHNWLFDPHLAMLTVAGIWIWIEAGFVFVICLSAMRAVPNELYEAGRIEGAGALRTFTRITLPLIWPVVGMVLLLQLVYTFNGFMIVWSTTSGGPGNATEILPVEVYRQAFLNGQFGYASAVAVGGGIVLAVITLLVLRITRSKVATT